MHKRWLAICCAVMAALTAGCTSATVSPSVSTPTPPSLTATPSPTPIRGLPDDHTLTPVNTHTASSKWAFITTTTGNPVGVRVNGLWRGFVGDLSDRSYSQPASQSPVDVDHAVPYYLSWSYVVLGGATDVEPAPLLLPSAKGNLYNVGSPFSDHDCPDYQPSNIGIGFLVTRCAVSLSMDNGYPVGLAFAVPDQTQQYWFMDARDPVPLPPDDGVVTTTSPPPAATQTSTSASTKAATPTSTKASTKASTKVSSSR